MSTSLNFTELDQEFTHLSQLLSTTTAPWQDRIDGLKRIMALADIPELSENDTIRRLYITSHWDHRLMLVSQIADRRSAVSKVAGDAMRATSSSLKSLLLNSSNHHTDEQNGNDTTQMNSIHANNINSAEKNVDNQPHVSDQSELEVLWIKLSCYWSEHLSPILPVTIKVISESAIAAFRSIIDDIAPLELSQKSVVPDITYMLISCIISNCSQKHAAIREHNFAALAKLLQYFPAKYTVHERSIDLAIEDSTPNGDDTNPASGHHHPHSHPSRTSTLEGNTKSNKSSISNSSSSDLPNDVVFSSNESTTNTPPLSTSSFFESLQAILSKGLQDSDGKARAKAREAFFYFHHNISPARALHVLKHLSAAHIKSYEQTTKEMRVNTLISEAASANDENVLQKIDNLCKDARKSGQQPRTPLFPLINSVPVSDRRRSRELLTVDFVISTGASGYLVGSVPESSSGSSSPNDLNNSMELSSADTIDQTTRLVSFSSLNFLTKSPNNLLSKLLSLDSPIITDSMMGYLQQPAIFNDLLAFVSCLPAELKDVPARELLNCQISRRLLPKSDEEILRAKRSYNVLQFLTAQRRSASLTNLINDNMNLIILHSLASFHPLSNGNLYHACKLLTKFSTNNSELLHSLLKSSNVYSVLFAMLFKHLHEPPVAECIVSLLAMKVNPQNDLPHIVEQHNLYEFLRFSITKPSGNGNSEIENGTSETLNVREISLSAYDFILALVDRSQTVEQLQPVFECLFENDQFIEQLLECITSPLSSVNDYWNTYDTSNLSPSYTNPLWQRDQACRLLTVFLKNTDKFISLSDPNVSNPNKEILWVHKREVANPLHFLRNPLITHCHSKIAALSIAVINSNSMGESDSISVAQLHLLDMIISLILSDEEVILRIPIAVWRVLTDWFLRFPHNSFYHASYKALFLAVISPALTSQSHCDLLRTILVDLELLNQLVVQFPLRNPADSPVAPSPMRSPSRSTSLCSYILVLCNLIRLTADLFAADHWLPSLLSSSSNWQIFLPTLRKESLLQVQPQSPSPTSPLPDTLPEESLIDLGSSFAQSLGFTQTPK